MKSLLVAGLTTVALVASAGRSTAAVIFADSFGTSTMNAAAPAAPTASSTNYQVLSSGNATSSSIAPASLQLNTANTSSRFSELQALFAAAPVALSQTGDFVELRVRFTAQALNSAASGTLNFGIYDSNGSAPVPGTQLNNSQMSNASSTHTSGFAADWTGYVGRIGLPGGVSSQLYTRPVQTSPATNEVQDALFNGAGSGAYKVLGTTIQTGGGGAALANQTDYLLVYRAQYDAGAATMDVSYVLSDANGTIDSLTGTASGAGVITTSFDALAIGYRATGSIGPFSLNIRSIEVEAQVGVIPEPTGTMLLVVALASGAVAHHRTRRIGH